MEPEMMTTATLSPEADRLRSLVTPGRLAHPYLSSKCFARQKGGMPSCDDDSGDGAGFVRGDNIVDLAAALSI